MPLIALALAGCGRSEEAQEADRIVRAIDVVRDAPNDPVAARTELLGKLEAEHPKGKLAAAARDACVGAYRLMLDAQVLEARVRGALSGPAEDLNPGVLADLGTAEAKLKESKLAMPECDRTLSELKRGFR